MHVKSLKVFCDVVACKSFSRAANENGMSQSGASQIVHQMEDELGVKLIDRSKRPFVLTPEGEVYYQGCRRLVEKFAALEEEVKTFHKEVEGRVCVASIYSVGLSHMTSLVKTFMARHPKANVRLEYQHPRRVFEMVENDQVDLGLVSYAKSSRNIEAIEWREEPMVMVCHPDHPLAEESSIALRQMDGLPFVGFDEDLMIRREIDKTLLQFGVEVQIVMEFDNIETLKRAIEIDAGIGLLPAPTIQREVQARSLAAAPIRDVKMARPLAVIHRRNMSFGPTAKQFLKFLLETDLKETAW